MSEVDKNKTIKGREIREVGWGGGALKYTVAFILGSCTSIDTQNVIIYIPPNNMHPISNALQYCNSYKLRCLIVQSESLWIINMGSALSFTGLMFIEILQPLFHYLIEEEML